MFAGVWYELANVAIGAACTTGFIGWAGLYEYGICCGKTWGPYTADE